jgi:hypothetical protein
MPRHRCNAVLAALACALPLAGASQDWVRFTGSQDGDEGFLDRNSLHVRGELRTVWTRMEKAVSQDHHGQPLKTWFAHAQVLCRQRMHRSLREIGFRPDGSLLFDAQHDGTEFRPVVPRTIGAIRLEAICELALPPAADRT